MRLFEHRLIDEERELAGRTSRLMAFTATTAFRELGDPEKTLLREQAVAMREYLSILQKRLALLKDKP